MIKKSTPASGKIAAGLSAHDSSEAIAERSKLINPAWQVFIQRLNYVAVKYNRPSCEFYHHGADSMEIISTSFSQSFISCLVVEAGSAGFSFIIGAQEDRSVSILVYRRPHHPEL